MKEMEDIMTTDEDVAAPGPIVSGAPQSNRIIPCEPAPGLSAPVAGETPFILPDEVEGETGTKQRKHTTCNPLVYEAMRVMEEHGYEPGRLMNRSAPLVTIIAMKGAEMLMISVINSRKPVPDAKTLRRMKPEMVDQLCAYAKPGQYKTMIWVNSPLCGRRYYRVDTGGISYDWAFAKMMEE
jgi:hypothetical protein